MSICFLFTENAYHDEFSTRITFIVIEIYLQIQFKTIAVHDYELNRKWRERENNLVLSKYRKGRKRYIDNKDKSVVVIIFVSFTSKEVAVSKFVGQLITKIDSDWTWCIKYYGDFHRMVTTIKW